MKTAIFSGRFDPPNLGHVITIQELINDYDNVLVVILDYPERMGCTALTAMVLFGKVFGYLDFAWTEGRCVGVDIITNNVHFGKITEKEIKTLLSKHVNIDKAIYVGGNKEVNKHIESLGVIPVKYIPRTPIYNSTAIRKNIDGGESLEEQYNINIKK